MSTETKKEPRWDELAWRGWKVVQDQGYYSLAGYGYVYTEWQTGRVVTAPIPLNVLWRLGRWIRDFFKHPWGGFIARQEGYRHGYSEGFAEGKEEGRLQASFERSTQ